MKKFKDITSDNCKTIDDLVDYCCHIFEMTVDKYKYHYLLIQFGEQVLKILKTNDTPSKHDLSIINEATKKIDLHNTYKLILKEYKCRKIQCG